MADPGPVLDDLEAESADLDRLVASLSSDVWTRPTPAPGWTVAHQVAHLAWTDDAALLALADEKEFARHLERVLAAPTVLVDEGARAGAELPPVELLERWRHGRDALLGALRAAPRGTRVPWYGPPMSVASMASARLMETWAHGLDIADALGVRRQPTDRLRHIARLGVRARDYAYAVHGRTPPGARFRVELTAPDGKGLWTYGLEDEELRASPGRQGPGRVTGPALDFCLLVTRRRHRFDLALTAEGAEANAWLDIAQAYAGPAGPGRAPGQFS